MGSVRPEIVGDPEEVESATETTFIARSIENNRGTSEAGSCKHKSGRLVCAWILGFLFGMMVFMVAAPCLLPSGGAGEQLALKTVSDLRQQLAAAKKKLNVTSRTWSARDLCDTAFVSNSFSKLAIEETENKLVWWMLHLDRQLESYWDNRTAEESKHPKYFKNHGRFEAILPPEGPACLEKPMIFGKVRDTSKPVCNVGGKLFNEINCDLLSLGSNNQWDTEVDMYKKTGCRIHTFDCTSDATQPASIRDRTFFHKICIGDQNFKDSTGREYMTWTSALQLAGMTKPPDYLKMDIEGFEYPVMRNLIDDGHLLPNQIAMEIHHFTYGPNSGNPAGSLSWSARGKDTGELLSFILMLYEKGYRLSLVDHNTQCPHCMEVLLSRVFC